MLIIDINGLLSKTFKVQRGMLQRDPVSPLLFVLVIESLSVAIGKLQWKKLSINGYDYSHSMFANNTWIYISDEEVEVEVMSILEKYELASNAKVNLLKSR